MSERLTADADGALLEFLSKSLSGWSRNTLRQRIRLGCVRVNGVTAERHDDPIHSGDQVEVLAQGRGEGKAQGERGPLILHLDDDLVAIDKPAGLLTVATDQRREGERTALSVTAEALAKPGTPPAKLWPVHRLDRETSGVLLLARSREICETLRAHWDEVRKVYLAIVEGHPDPAEGSIDQPLWEDARLNVHVGEHEGCRAASTRYRTCKSGPTRSLLEVELLTGRRHQIRAHLAFLGHPVVGDRRYGSADRRMALHASLLEFPHPHGGRRITLQARTPSAFDAVLRSKA